MSLETFDPWDSICSDGHVVFMERFCELFSAHLSRRKEESHQWLYRLNRASRKFCVRSFCESLIATCSGSPTSSAVSAPLVGTSSCSSSFRRSKFIQVWLLCLGGSGIKNIMNTKVSRRKQLSMGRKAVKKLILSKKRNNIAVMSPILVISLRETVNCICV